MPKPKSIASLAVKAIEKMKVKKDRPKFPPTKCYFELHKEKKRSGK